MNLTCTVSAAASIIDLTDLAPDERRGLLFDVNMPLEIPIDDFNDTWWPLVSNIWTQWNSYKGVNGDVSKVFACRFTKHRDSSGRQKENIPNEKRRMTKSRSSGLCEAKIKVSWLVSSNKVKVERYKDSPNHSHSLKEGDRIKRSKAIRTLVEQEAVKNYSPPAITAAIKEYATIKLGVGSGVRELKQKEVANIKYKVCGPAEAHLVGDPNIKIDISNSVSYLKEQGYQVEDNRVPERNTKGIVFAHPAQLKKLQHHGAHFYVSTEDSDTVGKALCLIRGRFCLWFPRYILSDQSSIEAKAVKKAFPGTSAGEQECEVILCVVHVMRVWLTKIYEKGPRDIMIATMHKRTKIGCENLVQDAIKCITSTNPLESYHSELKRATSSFYGLIGAMHHTVALDNKKRSDSEAIAFDFRIKKISAYGVASNVLEEIHKFPYPFQQLLVKEACSVMSRLEKGKNALGLTSLDCHCLFYNRYLLPCRHIFHEHTYGATKLLTINIWRTFQGMFEESGYEVYERRELVIEEIAKTEQQKKEESLKLAVNELNERVQDKYWHTVSSGNIGRTEAFVSMLEASIDSFFLQFDHLSINN
ncbi:7702_t:CDS:2 [Cetraspora pellucida]|uniref:7702_t:CDS:1 n=1 Tax=Cetraspora pellucida TaxID=1433469 RepID=A0A9N9CGR3_9GLOM|nr:7702_t:CDS:2 [Cetraspora pellucida]